MGSPYLASIYPDVQNYLCLYSTATVSETSAVKAIFGEIAVRGTLPVTLPGIAALGAGLQRGVGWSKSRDDVSWSRGAPGRRGSQGAVTLAAVNAGQLFRNHPGNLV